MSISALEKSGLTHAKPLIDPSFQSHYHLHMSTKRSIYLDHAATTPVDPRVLEAMLPYFSAEYGNAESLHEKGRNARIALDNSRQIVAEILNCQSSEIIFTGSGTEANNLAIFGTAQANKGKGRHLITTAIEHPSVLEPFIRLETEGYEVTRLKVDSSGLISLDELKSSIRPDTTIVSVMYANNEIGTIEPIAEISRICHERGVIFHTDACQAAGVLDLNLETLDVDLMTINASKIYGPKGVGALYLRKGSKIEPLIYGSNHENGLRAGTHNIPGIVGLAKALELAQKEQKSENIRLTELRDRLIRGILEKVSGSKLNGPDPFNGNDCPRLPNNINFSIESVSGQDLLLQLDEAGIFISTGAACQVRTGTPSYVLKAIGLTPTLIENSIRLTLGKTTDEEDITYVLETFPKLVEKIRKREKKIL